MSKKIFVLLFCVLLFSFVFAQDYSDNNMLDDFENDDLNYDYVDDFNGHPIDYEDLDGYIEDHNISYEDIEAYIDEHDISPEDIEAYIDEHDIDYDQIADHISDQEIQQIMSEYLTTDLIVRTFYDNLNVVKTVYNEEAVEEIPEAIQKIYNNQSYELVFITKEQDYNIYFDFDEIYLRNLSQNQIRDKLDLSIYVSEEVLETFINIDKFEDMDELIYKIRDHIVNKDIYLKPHGFINNFKYGIFNILRFMLSIQIF